MIEEIKPTTETFEHNGIEFEVKPLSYTEQENIELEASNEQEMTRLTLEKHLERMDETDFNPDEDSLDDVSTGFLVKLNEAIAEANGLEDFTDDLQHPTRQADQ